VDDANQATRALNVEFTAAGDVYEMGKIRGDSQGGMTDPKAVSEGTTGHRTSPLHFAGEVGHWVL
jgi:hypothetical protein